MVTMHEAKARWLVHGLAHVHDAQNGVLQARAEWRAAGGERTQPVAFILLMARRACATGRSDTGVCHDTLWSGIGFD